MSAHKIKLRNEYRLKRHLSIRIENLLLNKTCQELLPLLDKNQWLCIYWPFESEIDLRGLVQKPNIRVALPVVKKGQLHMHPWYPGDPLYPDDYGFPSPIDQESLDPNEIGILLAPGLAFDKCGTRLGYGGGYYDRLRSDPIWRSILSIIVAHSKCQVDQLPIEPWDIPFHGWLTELGLTIL